jgi:hypothetical protein
MNTVGILSAHIRHCSMLVANCLILSTTMAKAEPITGQQANAIGVDAYLYFYSLVTMDLTRNTDIPPASEIVRRMVTEAAGLLSGASNRYRVLQQR